MLELKKFAEYFERLYIDFVRYTIENSDLYSNSINFDKILYSAKKIHSIVEHRGKLFSENFLLKPITYNDNKLLCSLKFNNDTIEFNKKFCGEIIVYPNRQKYQYIPFIRVVITQVPADYFTIDISLEKLFLRAFTTRKFKSQFLELFAPINQRFFSIFSNNKSITLLIHVKNIPVVISGIEKDVDINYYDYLELNLHYRYILKLKNDNLQNKFTYRKDDKLYIPYKMGFKPKFKIDEIRNIVKTITESYNVDFPIYYDVAVYPNYLSSDEQVLITIIGKLRTGNFFILDLLLQE